MFAKKSYNAPGCQLWFPADFLLQAIRRLANTYCLTSPPPHLLSKVSIERLKSKSVLCFVRQILWPSPPWSHHVVNICVEISKPFPLHSVCSHADYCGAEQSESVSVCYFIFLYSHITLDYSGLLWVSGVLM